MSNVESGEARWIQPEWWGPPHGWIGGVVPFTSLLGKSNMGAVVVENLAVYPNGIAFDLHALMRREFEPKLPTGGQAGPLVVEHPGETSRIPAIEVEDESDVLDVEEPELPTERVHLAVEFDDGRRAARSTLVGGPGDFTIMAFQEGKPVAPDQLANIVMNVRGGAAGPDHLRERHFIWPFPPHALTFECEWEDVDIPARRVKLDESTLREALARARQAWPG